MQTFKQIIEIISLLSGPIIAYLAYKALEQIKEARKTRVINAKREAFTITAEKCEFYMSTIIPLINKVDEELKKQNIKVLKNSSVSATEEGLKISTKFDSENEKDIVFLELPTLDLFNKIESFCLFFVSGVAEEKLGYLTIGNTFIFTIKRYLPLIGLLSSDGHYQNTMQLFNIWNIRQEKEKLETNKKTIDKKLEQTKEINIPFIGEN